MSTFSTLILSICYLIEMSVFYLFKKPTFLKIVCHKKDYLLAVKITNCLLKQY